jgi:hypothetical protein
MHTTYTQSQENCPYKYTYNVGRKKPVGIETRYGLDGPEIESR